MTTITPTKFASKYTHNLLYKVYENNPIYWKSSIHNYFIQRHMDWKELENYEDVPEEYIDRNIKFTDSAKNLFQLETCDYWCEHRGRRPNSFLWTKHSSCQWMSRVNLLYATSVMPTRKWIHVADNEMNNGETHHYVMNEKGEILDPQGLTFNFQIEDYQKTFKPEMISNSDEMIETLLDYRLDYDTTLNKEMDDWKDEQWETYYENVLEVNV